MLDELGWQPLSEARLIMFYKIINGLTQVPFECVLIEVYKGTRRKHNIKFRYIGHVFLDYWIFFLSVSISVLPIICALVTFSRHGTTISFRVSGSGSILVENLSFFIYLHLIFYLAIIYCISSVDL